jgi:hypothetical protein
LGGETSQSDRSSAEEQAQREAQAQAQREAEELAQREVQEQAQREAEELAQREAQEQARRAATEKTTREAAKSAAARAASPTARGVAAAGKRSPRAPSPQPPAAMPAESEAPGTRAPTEPSGIVRQGKKSAGRLGLVQLAPAEGLLSVGHDAATVLFSLWTQQITGRIDFVNEPSRKSLFVEGGRPVAIQSNQPSDHMEEYLLREGKITRAQYQSVRSRGIEGARRIGSFLVTEGFLKPVELFPAVQGHMVDVTLSLFEWETGTYHYLPERPAEDVKVAVDRETPALVVEGIRRKHSLARLMNRVGAPSSLVTIRPLNDQELEALGFDDADAQLTRLFDGTRSVEDAVFATGVGLLRVYQILGAMAAMNLAQVRVRGVEGLDQSGATSGDSIDRQRIRDKVEQVRDQDYFQILGLARNATPYEIERAAGKLLQDFSPERFSTPVRRELAEEIVEITDTINQAYAVLSNDRLREAYAQHIAA